MSLDKVFGTILKTIEDVQSKNKSNPKEETASKDVFKLLKQKLKDLDSKTKDKRVSKGKSPESILDLIRKEIEGVRKGNRQDPNQKTAPKSVFDNILKKVEQAPQRQASAGLKKIVEDYRLDVSRLPQDVLQQFHQQYVKERRKFDNQVAQHLNNLAKKY